MSLYTLVVFCSWSISLAAIIGIARYPRVAAAFTPFIVYTVVCTINEMLSSGLMYYGFTHHVNSNIFVVAECGLLTWMFYRWRKQRGGRWLFIFPFFLLLPLWMAENIWPYDLYTPGYLSRIASLVIILMLVMQKIMYLSVEERGNIIRNPIFMICGGMLVACGYKLFMEILFYLQPNFSEQFFTIIFLIYAGLNFLVNLLYALASLWIPSRQKVT